MPITSNDESNEPHGAALSYSPVSVENGVGQPEQTPKPRVFESRAKMEMHGRLMERSISYIDTWYDNNPGQTLDPAELTRMVQGFIDADVGMFGGVQEENPLDATAQTPEPDRTLEGQTDERDGAHETFEAENTDFARAHNDRQHTHFRSRSGMPENSIKEVTEGVKGWAKENPLDAGALAVSPIPVVGDIAGFANDARHFIYEPESRTVGNMALSLAGLIPFVPPMAGIIQSTVRKLPQINLAEALKQPDHVIVDFGTLSSSKFRQLNRSLKKAGLEPLETRNIIIPVNVLKKLKEKRIINERMTADELADVIFSAVHGKKSKVTNSKHPHIKGLINARQGQSNVAFVAKNPKSGDTVLKSGYRKDTHRLKGLWKKKP